MQSNYIPNIDLSNIIDKDLNSDAAKQVSKNIKKASEEIGFFTVTNHGIPISKINNLVGNIKKIFNECDNNLSIGILENGISVRFLGSSSQEARKCFFCVWKQIRSVCGFCEPEYQGVWPLQDSMNY